MNRDEHKLEGEHLDLLDKLAAAKASGNAKKLDDAKRNLHEFRVKWRNIRDVFATGDGATPAPVKATTRKAGA